MSCKNKPQCFGATELSVLFLVNAGRLALLRITCSLTLVLDVREDQLTGIGTLEKIFLNHPELKKKLL